RWRTAGPRSRAASGGSWTGASDARCGRPCAGGRRSPPPTPSTPCCGRPSGVAKSPPNVRRTVDRFFDTYGSSLVETLVIVAGLWIAYLALARYGRRLIRRITDQGDGDTTRGDTLWAILRRLLTLALVVTLVLMV